MSFIRFVYRVVLFLLFPILAVAGSQDSQPVSCLRLGSKPSLIVKFKGVSSDHASMRNERILGRVQSSHATFHDVKPISDGAYILYFTPEASLRSQQVRPGCYAKRAIDALINDIKAKDEVEYIDPNVLMSFKRVSQAMTPPTIDPIQWDMLTPPTVQGGMDVQSAFSVSVGDPKISTAVLDTGILNNVALNPNVLTGVTFSNGFHGLGATPSCDNTCPGYDHGTHVSGTVASSGVLAYGLQIYGVAPQTKIVPVNIFTKFTDPADCGSEDDTPCLLSLTSDMNNAMNWLAGDVFAGLPAAQDVSVINMSLGGPGECGASTQLAINRVLAKNISIAVAAGNENVDVATSSPANCSGVMAVAATTREGYGAPYSNFGALIKYAAPGGAMTAPADPNGIYSTIENAYEFLQGTSMASPHAAGLAALMYSIDPTLTPAIVLSIMQATAKPFITGGPGDSCTIGRPCGAGILNANSAVLATLAQKPVLQWPSSPVTAVVNSTTQATITWKAAAWQPARSAGIVYTVNFDGVDVPSCSLTTTRTCVFTGLLPDSSHTVIVKAVDAKQMFAPVLTAPVVFQIVLTPPTLTQAVRDGLHYRQVYLYYSSLGGPTPDSYTVNNVPFSVGLTLDKTNMRFILSNVDTLDQIENVSISSVYGPVAKTSNAVTIPAVTISPPVLMFAERNPLKLSQVYIYYSALGGPPPDVYQVLGVPDGVVVILDESKHRFILDNVTSPKKIEFVSISSAYGSVVTESNYVTIPSIL